MTRPVRTMISVRGAGTAGRSPVTCSSTKGRLFWNPRGAADRQRMPRANDNYMSTLAAAPLIRLKTANRGSEYLDATHSGLPLQGDIAVQTYIIDA
jgi:hypothetical protein